MSPVADVEGRATCATDIYTPIPGVSFVSLLDMDTVMDRDTSAPGSHLHFFPPVVCVCVCVCMCALRACVCVWDGVGGVCVCVCVCVCACYTDFTSRLKWTGNNSSPPERATIRNVKLLEVGYA